MVEAATVYSGSYEPALGCPFSPDILVTKQCNQKVYAVEAHIENSSDYDGRWLLDDAWPLHQLQSRR